MRGLCCKHLKSKIKFTRKLTPATFHKALANIWVVVDDKWVVDDKCTETEKKLVWLPFQDDIG